MQAQVLSRHNPRRSSRMRSLFAVMLIVSVLGFAIVGVAVNMAERVEAFRRPNTGSYWAGVICLSLFIFYLPAHYFSMRKPDEKGTKRLFNFWVFSASLATLFLFLAAMTAAYYVTLISSTKEETCVYYNATGQATTKGSDCLVECPRMFKGRPVPKKTCCCCHTNFNHNRHTGIYIEGIDNCSDLFGVVSETAVALSAINSFAALFVLVASIMGCGLCCRCCGAPTTWTPAPPQEVVVMVGEPTHDKAPLLVSATVGLDVPPPYSAN